MGLSLNYFKLIQSTGEALRMPRCFPKRCSSGPEGLMGMREASVAFCLQETSYLAAPKAKKKSL